MSIKVKEYKGSFGQAFKAAEKAGDKLFRWFNPKSNLMEIFAVKHKNPNALAKNSTETANKNQKLVKKGKQQDRFLIRKLTSSYGTQYFVWDVQDNRPIGNAYNTAEEALDFLKSDLFGDNAVNVQAVAARTKLKGNEEEFVPVTSRTDLVDFEGKPRLYQNYNTGEYFLVDNYNNVIGKSTDANVEKIGFNQFRKADGSLTDLKERGSVELTARANRNEANLLTKQERDRKTDDRERQLQGIRNMLGIFNTVQGMANMPNHAIIGGLKLMRGDYTLDNYKKGFTIDGLWRGEQEVGLGDLLEIENPYGRFAVNLVNPMSLTGTALKSSAPKLELTTVKGKPLVVKSQAQGKLSGSFRRGTKSNEGMGTNQRGKTQYGGRHIAGLNNGPVLTSKMDSYVLKVNQTPGLFNPTPFDTAFRYDPETQVKFSPRLNPRLYEYTQGVSNPWVEKGYANPWTSDNPYIPGTVKNGRVDVTNSYGFNTPFYSGETIGSGGFDSKQWPQLKTH